MARGLVVKAFFEGSHRAFADGLVGHRGHNIELLTLLEIVEKLAERGDL